MDMDTRIKCGIIFKLKIPEEVTSRISKVIAPPAIVQYTPSCCISLVCLGPTINVIGTIISISRYVLQRLHTNTHTSNSVININNDRVGTTFTHDDVKDTWFEFVMA